MPIIDKNMTPPDDCRDFDEFRERAYMGEFGCFYCGRGICRCDIETRDMRNGGTTHDPEARWL